jgi:hypothetical protein
MLTRESRTGLPKADGGGRWRRASCSERLEARTPAGIPRQNREKSIAKAPGERRRSTTLTKYARLGSSAYNEQTKHPPPRPLRCPPGSGRRLCRPRRPICRRTAKSRGSPPGTTWRRIWRAAWSGGRGDWTSWRCNHLPARRPPSSAVASSNGYRRGAW